LRQRALEEQYWNSLRARWSQYGFQPGTDAFAQCVQKEARAAEASARANKEAEAHARRRYACSMGNAAMCDNPPRQTNCTRDALGNVNCITL